MQRCRIAQVEHCAELRRAREVSDKAVIWASFC